MFQGRGRTAILIAAALALQVCKSAIKVEEDLCQMTVTCWCW